MESKMRDTVLTLTRFRALAEAYGSDLGRWPEGEREAARELLERSAEARELLAAERSLDEAFASLAAPPLPPGLQERLARVPDEVRAPRRLLRLPRRTLVAPALGWAAAAALGLWLGARSAPDGTTPIASEVTSASQSASESDPGDAAFGEGELGEAEVLALASGRFSEWEEP